MGQQGEEHFHLFTILLHISDVIDVIDDQTLRIYRAASAYEIDAAPRPINSWPRFFLQAISLTLPTRWQCLEEFAASLWNPANRHLIEALDKLEQRLAEPGAGYSRSIHNPSSLLIAEVHMNPSLRSLFLETKPGSSSNT
jgi:hypothetical protein